MSKILILLSHPTYSQSRVNAAMSAAAASLPGVEIAHLEAIYPDGRIDTDAEVARILAAERIILQFPVFWYSTPPLLKAWQDAVLTRMFYINPRTEGDRIAGRPLMVAATAGNSLRAYSAEGPNLFSLADLLKPLQSTANRCGLRWEAPFLAFGAKAASEESIADTAKDFAERLKCAMQDA